MTEADHAVRIAFGDRVRELRKQAKLSQEELAERCELTANYIGNVERAENSASVIVVFRLARALEVKATQLFEGIGVI